MSNFNPPMKPFGQLIGSPEVEPDPEMAEEIAFEEERVRRMVFFRPHKSTRQARSSSFTVTT